MKKRSDRHYCTLDHANKRRELAQQTPYQFWVKQATRQGMDAGSPGDGGLRRRTPGSTNR